MNAESAVAGLLCSLLLPWFCGGLWAYWWLGRSGRYNLYSLAGQGFVLGIALVIGLICGADALGMQLQFWPLASVLAGLSVLALVVQRLFPNPVLPQAHWEPIPRWHMVAVGLLMAAIVWRHVSLLEVLMLRPVFTPEAWSDGVLPAFVWFAQGSLTPFVEDREWLLAAGEVYANNSAPAPRATSLVQLWSLLGTGGFDNSFIFLPWLLVPTALGLALFGHLRLAGVPTILACIASYSLLSLPVVNEYTVLHGYWEIWLTLSFSLGVFALHQWRLTGHWSWASWCLFLAALCPAFASSGVVFAALLCLGLCWAWAFRRLPLAPVALRWGVQMVLVAALVVPALWLFSHPHSIFMGSPLSVEALSIEQLGTALYDGIFLQSGWHLLWFVLLGLLFLRRIPRGLLQWPEARWMVTLAALVWGLVQFRFTAAGSGDFANLSAALLPAVPPLVFCLFLSGARQVSDVQ